MRVLAWLLLAAPLAYGHGGGRFRGPSGGVPPGLRRPNIDCACGRCSICTTIDDRADPRIRVSHRVEIVERKGDLARVVVRLGFLSLMDSPRFATIRLPGLLATGTRVERAGENSWHVLRRGELRVYPVAAGRVTRARIEGVAVLVREPRIFAHRSRALVFMAGRPPETMPLVRALMRYPGFKLVNTTLALPAVRVFRAGDPRRIPGRPYRRPDPPDPPDPPPPPPRKWSGNPPR